MTVDTSRLAAYVGTGDLDDAHLAQSLEVATALVDSYLEQAYREVPAAVRDQIILDSAHNVYKRRDSVSGASQFAFENGVSVFDPKDVLQKSMPMLRRYVLPL